MGRSYISLVGNSTTGENLGAGAKVFKGKSNGNNLQFRTITATGSSIQIIETADQIFVNYTGVTNGLQQVTEINAATNIESTFSEGLITNKIRPSGDTVTAIQINKANGSTPIINVDTVSGFTGFGTIAPKGVVHAFGNNPFTDAEDTQRNAVIVDGSSNVDKDIQWAENGQAQWLAETYRDENGVFWYLYNVEAQNSPLTIMETGRIGINKQTNFINYHASQVVGNGLNDIVLSGVYTENFNTVYEVEIVAITGVTDTWHWKKSIDNGVTFGSYYPDSGCTLTPVLLEYGVYVNFENLTGHTVGNIFEFAAYTQIPQGTFTIAPMGIAEIERTLDYTVTPVSAITYTDLTGQANGGFTGNDFEIFGVGASATTQAFYWGTTVPIHSMYFNLETFGTNIVLYTQYWDGATWTTLNTGTTNNYIDFTNNLTKSGRLAFAPNTMTGWGKFFLEGKTEAGYDLYWMRIITSTAPGIAPVGNSISIGNDKRFSVYSAFNDYRPSYYVDSLGRVNIGGGNITGSNRFQVNTGNNVAVTATGTDSLVEFDSENSAVVDLKIKLTSNDACGPGLTFVKTRGTLDVSSCTQTGDILGAVKFRGRAGTFGRLLSEIGSQFTGSATTRCGDIYFNTANGSDPVERVRIRYDGNTGFGVSVPTATIHIKSGTTTNAPLKFNSGDLLSGSQAGAVEFLTDAYYGTITSGNARKTFAFLEAPQFTGNVNLPNTTCLVGVNLCNFILNSGGTNNACLVKTCTFNAFTANTVPIVNSVVTGATNGLNKPSTRLIGLGGNLTQNTTISGNTFDFTLSSKALSLCGACGITIRDSSTCAINITNDGGDINLRGNNVSCVEKTKLLISATQATFTDSRVTPVGLQYDANYCASYTCRSIPDVEYVNNAAGGGTHILTSVQIATTSNVLLSGLTTIDGILLVDGYRILVKNQTTGSTNGIYVATGTTWQRASDFNFTPSGQPLDSDLIPVISGNTNGNTIWALTTPNPISSGDTLTFSLFSQTSGVVAANGICVTQSSGNYNVAVKAPTNCGLCIDSTGVYVNSAIAGLGLDYASGVINLDGSGLAGNSITWSANTFNVNPSIGTLNTALNSKLNTSAFNLYSGNTLSNINSRLLKSTFSGYTGTTVPNTYLTISNFNTYTGTTVPNNYYTKTCINAYTGATQSILNAKAFLSGATFTGVVNVCKPGQNDNTNCAATTSWYISQGGTATPIMDGVGACGISNLFARQDHVHPSDTSRLAVSAFNTYSGTTVPNTYYNKTQINTYTGTTVPNTYYNKTQINTFTGTTLPANYYNKTQINAYTGATLSNINSRVLKAGDTMTGALVINSNLTVTGTTILRGRTCLGTPGSASTVTDRTLFWNPTSCAITAKQLTGGSDSYFYVDKTTLSTSAGAGLVPYLSGAPWTFLAGRYQIDFSAQYGNTTNNGGTCLLFALDGVTIGSNYIEGGMSTPWNSSASLSRDVTLTAGCHCLTMSYCRIANTSCMTYGAIRAKRIC